MAYIYQIVNKINGKIYVGKTEFSLEKRFKEHCADSKKEGKEKRPLYAAMRKYGIENFYIELLEETDNPEEREKFWIEEKGSFKYGYNATTGGDGKPYLDYDLIVATYLQLGTIEETAKQLNCDRRHLSLILKARNVEVKTSPQVNREKFGQLIDQFDLNGNYIQTFSSATSAAITLRPDYNKSKVGGVTSHITDVCKGKRKTAYGYIWRYSLNNEKNNISK